MHDNYSSPVHSTCWQVLGQFVPTDIISECNMKNNSNTGQSSKAQNEEFHLKRQKFLKECLEKDIFLEALITSVFMNDNNLTDVCESGITKASHFSELGDLQTLMSAVSQWCKKLHTRSGKKKSQQVAWFNKNGLKGTIFKEIDEHLRDHYTEVVAQVSDLKKPTTLNFNKDVQLVHETMTETIAKLWYNRLCIYQGYKDLGYMQISSKVPGLIGRKSCYRLTNEPPRFVLALDALTRDHIPEQLNLLVSVGEDLVASILSKYHNTTPKVLVDQFFCIPVTTEYMSFELGALASSETFCNRLKLISGHVIKISYDRDLKQLRVLCPQDGCDRVRSVLEEELKSLRMELETKELEIPFPNLHSPLRLQIGEGLQCLGIVGFQWYRGKQLREVHIRKCASTSEAEEICPIHEDNDSYIGQRKMENMCDFQHFSAIENAVEYECYTESLIPKQTNILVDDLVIFDSSVEIILNCLINHKDERNGNGLMSFEDAKTFVIAGVIWAFAEAGLRTDGRDNNTAIWAQKNSENPRHFEIKLVFPNVHTAVAGARCIESISRSNFSVCLRHPTKLATDLRTIRITMAHNFYHLIEKPLEELLGRKQDEHVVENWIIKDPLSSVNHSNINLQTLVSVTATANCHVHNLTQTLEGFFQPAKVTFDNMQLHYLQSNEGTKFLKFLMHFTKTCVHVPEFHKKAYIYGDRSNKSQSVSILKRQLVGKAGSCGLSWHLFDFDKTCFNSHALKILYHDMRSRLDKLKCSGDISQYFLFEDRPELWLETKADVFSRYSEEVKSTLLQHSNDVVVRSNPSPEQLDCTICYAENLVASNKDSYLLTVCGHAFCRECLLQLVIRSTKYRNLPIRCAFRTCKKALSVAELWYICGVVQDYDITKVLRDVLRSFVADNAASFALCTRRRCGSLCVVYEQDKMKACLWCQGKFCLKCDGKFHGTMACEDVWNARHWLKENSQNRKCCPNCRIAIEKLEGCNTVFCAWCKNYMCWNCGQFNSKNSNDCYAHINTCVKRIK